MNELLFSIVDFLLCSTVTPIKRCSTSQGAIPLINLAITFIPVAGLLLVFFWSLNALHALYGVLRMLVQLLLIGYLLAFIFDANHAGIILGVLVVMVCAASWIALGNVPEQRTRLNGFPLGPGRSRHQRRCGRTG